jgi:hypothetical protein
MNLLYEVSLIFFGSFFSMTTLGLSMSKYGDSTVGIMIVWNTGAFWLVCCLIVIAFYKMSELRQKAGE